MPCRSRLGEPGGAIRQLLNAAFAKIGRARRDQRLDHVGRDVFCYRNQPHAGGNASGPPARRPDPVANDGQIRGESPDESFFRKSSRHFQFRFYTVGVTLDTILRLWHRLLAGLEHPWEFLVELFLIGLSVNWCAGVLHGTRGTRLLRGLLILLVAVTLIVRILAANFGWTRLELLYGYFVTGLAFIALVAFQPELRRALIRAGDMRFLQRRKTGDSVIGAVVESAGYLARNRHGALIAIQRDVGLADWTEHGTPLHADVTANLLNAIFFPNSPLHDLGVVIRGNRVLAAACQFPMAESGELDPLLGSRHRAAVGLSEETDALVIVVSEETGIISLADRGELIRHLSLDDLERELTRRLSGQPTGKSGWSGRSFTDLKRFVRRAAIVIPLTLVIWFLADQASLRREDNIGIELIISHDASIQPDVTSPIPPSFRIAVRGSNRDVEALRSQSPLKATWKVAAPYNRPREYNLNAGDIKALLQELPELRRFSVILDDVSPDAMTLSVDEVVTVTLPVRPEGSSRRVSDARFEPPTASVSLRSRDFARLSEAQRFVSARVAEALASAAPDQSLTLDRVPLDERIAVGGAESVPLLRVEPPEVKAAMRVVGERVRRALSAVSVQVSASPSFLQRYDVVQADANEWLIEFEVEGDRSRVESLTAQDVFVHVPLSSESPSAEFRTAEVILELPEGVTLVGPPKVVQFKLVPRELPP